MFAIYCYARNAKIVALQQTRALLNFGAGILKSAQTDLFFRKTRTKVTTTIMRITDQLNNIKIHPESFTGLYPLRKQATFAGSLGHPMLNDVLPLPGNAHQKYHKGTRAHQQEPGKPNVGIVLFQNALHHQNIPAILIHPESK